MHYLARLLAALSLLASTHLLAQNSLYFPPKTGTTWETLAPATLGFCPDRIDSLYRMLEERNTKSFILLHDGKIVLEKYFGTFTRDSIWYWASAGKSLSAFLVGQAQEAGLLDLNAPVSTYLGTGWTSAPPNQEALITVRDQLRMTTGLDDAVADDNCTDPACLVYKADAGTRWAYHNAPYHLVHDVISSASGQGINIFTKTRLFDRIGMNGLWINHVQYGRARDMARFGLLMLANGVWSGDTLLRDQQYLYDMTHPSQTLNRSYGYLWWLTGQPSFMLPGVQFVFPGKTVPNAPDDTYMALGKNDQKIHVTPSKGWVWVRQGDAAAVTPGGNNVPIVLDNLVWQYLNALVCTPVQTGEARAAGQLRIAPNPASDWSRIAFEYPTSGILTVQNMQGQVLLSTSLADATAYDLNTTRWPSGVYMVTLRSPDGKWYAGRIAVY